MRGLSNLLIGLCLAGIFAGAGGMAYSWVDLPPANGGLPDGVKVETSTFLERHQDVVAAMGTHPESGDVYDALATLWGRDTGWDGGTVARALTVAFRNETLGLYALQKFIDSGGPAEATETFSLSLIADYPDSRAACMALEHVLRSEGDGALARCDAVLSGADNSRVQRYALMQKGDLLAGRGDLQPAQLAWYHAWASAPEMGPSLYNRLFSVWIETGDWFAPALLGTEFLDEEALRPLVTRLALRVERDGQGELVGGKEYDAVAALLTAGDRKGLSRQLGILLDAWPQGGSSSVEQAERALALFFLEAPGDTVGLPLQESLALKNELERCRHGFLDRARAHFDALTPDLRAAYTLRAANRLFQDFQIGPALEMLEGGWRDRAISRPWRERLLARYAETLAREQDREADAAAAYLAYCEMEPEAPARFRAEAGLLLYASGAFEAALTSFSVLAEAPDTLENEALAFYMQGVCHARLRQYDRAREHLEKVLDRCPATDFAPRAIEQLSTMAIASDDYARARDYLADLRARYPDWQLSGNMIVIEREMQAQGPGS